MPILLFLFWIILNGRFGVDVIITGIIATGLVSLFAYRILGFSFSKEKRILAHLGQLISYLVCLICEVIKANIHVISLILSEKIEIEPQLIYFDSPVKSEFAKVLLANSITLTPGTITVSLEGDRFGIHAIDKASSQDITQSVFVKRLQRMERD